LRIVRQSEKKRSAAVAGMVPASEGPVPLFDLKSCPHLLQML
jgi:hypothetical protein